VPGIGSYRAALEAHASKLGIANRVVFAGAIDKLQVARHLAAADVHLAPSVIDTYNYAVLEATFVGTPSLMSQMVGAGPWVVEAGGGEIVATRNPSDWGEKLAMRLARSPTLQSRRTAADKLGAVTHPERIATELLAVLKAR
jgi:glycosyltransferase involved in cell wall biosynthesis